MLVRSSDLPCCGGRTDTQISNVAIHTDNKRQATEEIMFGRGNRQRRQRRGHREGKCHRVAASQTASSDADDFRVPFILQSSIVLVNCPIERHQQSCPSILPTEVARTGSRIDVEAVHAGDNMHAAPVAKFRASSSKVAFQQVRPSAANFIPNTQTLMTAKGRRMKLDG